MSALSTKRGGMESDLKAISGLKNIHSALDSQETEAWQKLIRVLTHEIMNSITPIISLTELLSRQIPSFFLHYNAISLLIQYNCIDVLLAFIE